MAGIFERQVVDTENFRGTHHSVPEGVEDSATFSVHRIVMQGEYADLKAVRDEHYCNEVVTDTDTFLSDFTGCKGDKVIVGMALNRKEGGRGELVITVKLYQRGYEGGIDFETVCKDIHYWRQLCETDVPDLAVIRLWEAMKDDAATVDYFYDFKYVDKNGGVRSIESDTATYKLAEMIARGVESYNEYVPVLTITYNLAAHPTALDIDYKAGALLGKVVEASEITLNGQGLQNPVGTISGGISPVSDFEQIYEGKILCTADQCRINADGSCTITRCFTKFRAIEPELYIGAGGQYGPYDSDAQ